MRRLSRMTRKSRELNDKVLTLKVPGRLLAELERQARSECATVSTVARRLMVEGLRRIASEKAA